MRAVLITIFLFFALAGQSFALSFEKAAYEEFYRYFDFKNLLNATETISTATVTVKDADTGQDMSSSMVSNVAPYNNTMVIYKIKGGTAGHSYNVTIQVVTSTGQKFSNDYHEPFLCVVKR